MLPVVPAEGCVFLCTVHSPWHWGDSDPMKCQQGLGLGPCPLQSLWAAHCAHRGLPLLAALSRRRDQSGHWGSPGCLWGHWDGTSLPCCSELGAAFPSGAGGMMLPAQHSGWHRSHLSTSCSPATIEEPGINHGKGIERRKMGIFNK